MVSSTPRPHFTPGKDPVPILQEAGWAPGPVWTSGKSRPHRHSIPDLPARSQSLYRLSCPARPFIYIYIYIYIYIRTHTSYYYQDICTIQNADKTSQTEALKPIIKSSTNNVIRLSSCSNRFGTSCILHACLCFL